MKSRAFLPGQLRLILAVTLVHAVAWFAYYSQIPPGEIPNEEARQTLEAALNLAAGSSVEGEGHSLYIYALSVLARFFNDVGSLTAAARGLNACALLIAAGIAASAAGHYWRRNRAVWIAGLLIGLNPVLVFWAGEVSPSLLATTLMSIALWRGLRWLRHPRIRDNCLIGICLTAAALLETTLLPIALFWPLLACLHPSRERIIHLILGLAPLLITLTLLLVSNLQLEDTFSWHTDRLGLNIYQALSNAEGHDIKSYSLYRQLHLILFLNPIHWGLLFLLATGGAYVRLKDGHRGRSIWVAVSVLTLFAVSYALNGSGSEARASLIPLLAILSGGVAMLPKIWGHASYRTRRKIITGGLLTGLFVYAGFFFGTPQSEEWEHDYAYLAEANIVLGNNNRATTWAKKALELDSDREDMQEVLILAQFNDWALGSQQRTLPLEEAKALLEASRQIKGTPTIRAIQGVYLYKIREVDAARDIWQAEREQSALALLCLYWTNTVSELNRTSVKAYSEQPYFELLKAAQQIDRNAIAYGETEKRLDNILGFAY